MKFKLDENLGTLGKTDLEADDHDVMTVSEQDLSGASDVSLYEICRDEGRILVTLDHDFGQTLRFPPENTAGIVVLECQGRQSQTAISARLNDMAMLLREQPIEGKLWIVEPGRVRIHER